MSSRQTSEGWYAHSEKTSRTDDQRIKEVSPLPPPEHLIKFFPIAGTAVEKLVDDTRLAERDLAHRLCPDVNRQRCAGIGEGIFRDELNDSLSDTGSIER